MTSKFTDDLAAANETDRIFEKFNGSLDDMGENCYIVEAKAGRADLRVSEGKSIVLDSITKDSDGGITNIKVASDASLSVDGIDGSVGVINALGKLTTGSNSSIWFDKVTGTNYKTSISIGKNSRATFEEGLDLMGGINSFTVGSSSDVLVFNHFKNISKIKLAGGSADAKTYLVVTDNIAMPSRRSSITIGNHAVLLIQGTLDNSDVNTGTVIKAGKNSLLYSNNMFYIEKITMGAGSSFGIGGMAGDGLVPNTGYLFGTTQSNTFSFGANMKGVDTGDKHIHIGEVDMKGGKNTFSIGSGTIIYVDNEYNVTKDPISHKLIITVEKINDLYNITNLKLASGKSDDYTGLHVGGSIVGTDYKNKITIGNYAELTAGEKLIGFNSVKVGKHSRIKIQTAIEFVRKITVGDESCFYAGDISGTGAGDTLSFGRESEIEIKSIDFGDDRKDALAIGQAASCIVKESITGVDAFYAAKGAVIIAAGINDAAEIELDSIRGSWQNAFLYNTQDDLIAGTTELGGQVYGNEWDVYSFDCSDSTCSQLTLSELSPDGEVAVELYKHTLDGFDRVSVDDWSNTLTGLDGRYSLLVRVEGADFAKDGGDDYGFKATLA